jgi:hypothetical protein
MTLSCSDFAIGVSLYLVVIPGRSEATSPESITTDREYGFRACAFGASRNDESCYLSFVKMIVPDAANIPPTP